MFFSISLFLFFSLFHSPARFSFSVLVREWDSSRKLRSKAYNRRWAPENNIENWTTPSGKKEPRSAPFQFISDGVSASSCAILNRRLKRTQSTAEKASESKRKQAKEGKKFATFHLYRLLLIQMGRVLHPVVHSVHIFYGECFASQFFLALYFLPRSLSYLLFIYEPLYSNTLCARMKNLFHSFPPAFWMKEKEKNIFSLVVVVVFFYISAPVTWYNFLSPVWWSEITCTHIIPYLAHSTHFKYSWWLIAINLAWLIRFRTYQGISVRVRVRVCHTLDLG